MATNKFATMLHRNTNRITIVLIYAILEWILIVLLLLNSLFSYLILKFADYFGLKRPCLWCSRLDHILEPGKSKTSYRDLVCEAHASEISKLGYCSKHRKLVQSQDMCEGCSSPSQPDCPELSKRFAFFPWMNKIGFIQNGGENGEENLKCSCCDVSLGSEFYSPCILIKSSWEDFDYSKKQNMVAETPVDTQTNEGDPSDRSRSDSGTSLCEHDQSIGEKREIQIISEVITDGGSEKREEGAEDKCSVCDFGCKESGAEEDDRSDMFIEKEREPIKEEKFKVSMDDRSCDQTAAHVTFSKDTDTSNEIRPQHLEFFIDREDCRLIPVELIGSAATEDECQPRYQVEDQGNCENEDVILDFDMHVEEHSEPVVENWHSAGETVALLSAHKSKEEPKFATLESLVMVKNESNSVLCTQGNLLDLWSEECEQVAITQATQTPSDDDDHEDQPTTEPAREMDSDVHLASEGLQVQSSEFDAEISIGTEIPDQEPLGEALPQEALPSYEPGQGAADLSTSSVIYHGDDDNGSQSAEEVIFDFKTCSVETTKQDINIDVSLCSNLFEIEEEKVPDTPTSVDSLHHLHHRLLMLGSKESGTEESLDGSVISEIEGGELTIEKLKSALKAERKALYALYGELEEERSSSAVAANQTMAMINRLQEEKAAMQMEALQYQRMMDEQSEYDQEALQLLNDLMIKREKEKQELEKELEIYRRKVQDYEAREKMNMSRRRDSSTRSSASCSNMDDSDALSIDLNPEAKGEDSFYGNQESSSLNTPTDAVLYLEESLLNFEEERLSILQQLKELEEKLFILSDEEEQHFEDVKPYEHSFQENGNGYHNNSGSDSEANVVENGHSKEMNGKHHQETRIKWSKPKRLLPLFDSIVTDGEVALANGHEQGFSPIASQKSLDTKFELEKKLAIEEEVDHVYERLQALEADREFLKHCVGSLSKGDKGLDLLQDILEHLRDLRSVELRFKKMGDGALY
ncbi:hypothetical protein I3760_05G190200 [Carya illinoinensis]|nr:hypothetical protein I3760_05G190200 [Carya illinoinensis]KAG2708381.1 hypothetical protein I3760_05G190200 [Carya illinoinensis]KAG2708382.1 hypothetical protein I3760_05G190200 [Carya illinoinensis]